MEKTKGSTAVKNAVVGFKLLLICAIVAAVVAFVYQLTLSKYQENLQQTKNLAVAEIFGREGARCEELYTDPESGTVVYCVYYGEDAVVDGYCVEAAAPGFGGDVSVMVGYREDRSILGVSVISMSETPGLGSKVGEKSFLEQYQGKMGNLELGSDVDAISGATVSSGAMTDAVNLATKALESAVSATLGGEAQ